MQVVLKSNCFYHFEQLESATGQRASQILRAQITSSFLDGYWSNHRVILHEITGTRNSSFDYLGGEQFYQYSTIVLVGVTIFSTVGLFPWWAFEPLDNPKKYELHLDHINKQLHILVQNAVLHQRLGDATNTARQGKEEA